VLFLMLMTNGVVVQPDYKIKNMSVYSNLIFSTQSGAEAMVARYSGSYPAMVKDIALGRGNNNLRLLPTQQPANIEVIALRWRAYQTARKAMYDSINEYNLMQLKQRMTDEGSVFGQNQRNITQLISNTELADSETYNELGVIVKYMGKVANEALVMWIPSDTEHEINFQTYADKIRGLSRSTHIGSSFSQTNKNNDTNFQRVKVKADPLFIDLSAMVQFSSQNNIILTNVQGRDCSRKEYISAGDMKFSVQGRIFSNYPDVYPYAEVSKLRRIFQHKGTVKVANLMFDQYNVTEIVITDFSMTPTEGMKNVQNYQFNCVAIEPNKIEGEVKDTISVANTVIREQKALGWTNMMLTNLANSGISSAIDTVDGMMAKYI